MDGGVGINIAKVVWIEGRNIFWGDRDMMVEVRPYKRTDIGAVEKT